jgi:hypothetical protein
MLSRLELPHSYEVRVRSDSTAQPDAAVVHYFPPRADDKPVDGLVVEFRPRGGQSWIGCFSRGTSDENALTVVLSSPNPESAFVVCGGAGYSVRVDSPNEWHKLPVSPIISAEIIADQKVVVLGSDRDLAVYRPGGLSWFRRVVADGLQVQGITGGQIRFRGMDTDKGKTVDLRADIDTGKDCS